MATPKSVGRYVYESEEALCGLVVAGRNTSSVFEPVKAALDPISRPVE